MSVGRTAGGSKHTVRAARGKSPATVKVGVGRGIAQRTRKGARRKRHAFGLEGSCDGTAQVIFGVGVTARKAGRSESKHGLDLVGRYTTAQQLLGDPQVGDAPIGRRETLGNAQPVQPTGIDVEGCGRCEGAGSARGVAWCREGRTSCGEEALSGLQQRGGLGSQAGLGVQESDPGSVTAEQAACGFLIGEPGEPSQMTALGAGAICAIQISQVSGDEGSQGRLERGRTDTNPGLQMAGAGAQHGTRLMPIGTHGVDDFVLGAVQIDQNVAGVEAPFPGVEKHIVPFAIAQPQKSNHGSTQELHGGPHMLSRKRPSAGAVNQTNLIIIARHGGQLSAHSLQGDKESAIHDRDCNIPFESPHLKPEVLTLQKTGSFHFALTVAA